MAGVQTWSGAGIGRVSRRAVSRSSHGSWQPSYGGSPRVISRCTRSHDTIAPLVRYDEQYGSDLVATLEAWFEHDCSTVATAGAIFVHRHTVAYRLERVKELSGLDPLKSEDRERLGLGLKAGRVIGPRTPN